MAFQTRLYWHRVLDCYAQVLQTLNFDRIAGIPYGSRLPTATGLSLQLQKPLIYPRKEVGLESAHGNGFLTGGRRI